MNIYIFNAVEEINHRHPVYGGIYAIELKAKNFIGIKVGKTKRLRERIRANSTKWKRINGGDIGLILAFDPDLKPTELCSFEQKVLRTLRAYRANRYDLDPKVVEAVGWKELFVCDLAIAHLAISLSA